MYVCEGHGMAGDMLLLVLYYVLHGGDVEGMFHEDGLKL